MRLLALLVTLGLALAQPAYLLTPKGPIQGGVNQAAKVAYFLGIPYAKAERWKAPVAAEPWKGVLQATHAGYACPQRSVLTSRLGGYIPPQSEDCLSLNVWVPLAVPPEGGWGVMVWLHGGSFTGGSAGEPVYDGANLASRGVIVVSLNYRLGVFGYLALPALQREDPQGRVGNYGTLDQLEALRWVQANIASFGGNPRNVTVFGQSAGGMAVCTLLASPLAKGLFQKAVIESGGCTYVKTLESGFKFGQALAKLLGCDGSDLACLRALPRERFFPPEGSQTYEAIRKLIGGTNPGTPGTGETFAEGPYKPHLDGVVLDTVPLQALREGRAAGIPLLGGATTQEAWLERLDVGSWETFAERVRRYLPERAEALTAEYRRRYRDPGEAWAYLITDSVLFCPTYAALQAQSAFAPTYAYIFDYTSPVLPILGSFHGAEVPWLFGTFSAWPFLGLYLTDAAQSEVQDVAGRLQAYWARFAQDNEPGGWPRWPEYASGQVLRFSGKLGLRPDPYPQRCSAFR
jgi:para-nitrobenzyl esterase